MARNFAAASSQYLENTSLPVSATPLTIAAWFKPVSATAAYFIGYLGASGSNINYWALATDTSGRVTASTNGVTATTSTSVSAGVWAHGCAVFASATDRRAFLNGGGKGTSATSRTPSSPVRLGVGCLDGSSRTTFMNGDIAELAIWNVALSDAEVLMLSTGVSPLMVRPDALKFYAPLMGRASPEPDYKGTFNLTLPAAAPTQSAHPRIFYFSSGKSNNATSSPDATVNATGISATASAGVPVPSIGPTDTGISATASVGTPTPTIAPTITGVSATGAVGTTTENTDDIFGISGVQATASAGTPTPQIAPTITGISATAAVGTTTESGDANITGTGISATGQAGTPTPQIQPQFPGIQASAAVGNPTPEIDVFATGIQATGAVGVVTVTTEGSPDATVNATGISATASVGTVVPEIEITAAGIQATAQTGTPTPQESINPTGIQATGAAGQPGPQIDGIATGIQATGQVGSVISQDTIAQTGVSATALAGTLIPQISPVQTGIEATASVGTPGLEIDVIGTGISCTGFVGIATAELITDASGEPIGIVAVAYAGSPVITLLNPSNNNVNRIPSENRVTSASPDSPFVITTEARTATPSDNRAMRVASQSRRSTVGL